mgnify:CR=1 FL=1
MRLVYRIVLHLAWVLSLLLAVWAVLFYFALTARIDREVDDALEVRAEVIIRQVLSGHAPASEGGGTSGYKLFEVPAGYAASRPQTVFSDEQVYIPERDNEEPARVLRMMFRDRAGQWRELTVTSPTVEKTELVGAVLWWIVGLYVLLLGLILIVTAVVLHRTMKPLYALLRWLDAYTVGAANPPLEADTKVVEFRRLNDAARRYAARAESLFDRQKQFIGNASHELQTPLAVLGGRMEYMLDHAGLDEQTMGEVIQMQRTLGHIVRLNKTLLLLAKIDNGQFPENTDVDISAMIREQKELYDDIYEERDIRCDMHLTGSFLVRMNESLASVLVSNLIRNAYVHSEAGARIDIRIEGRTLTVSNDGVTPLDGKHIFERFYQGSKREGSTGLGLALVKAVADSYGLCVGYRFGEEQHIFSVEWPQ